MEKYAVLLGYFDKQLKVIERLRSEIETVDISHYDSMYVFALKTQQFYTAIEDLFKQIAKAFENNIDSLSSYHKELLTRMNTEVSGIRPALLSDQSLSTLNKIRAFRHFIRHAYDCELDSNELAIIQTLLQEKYPQVHADINQFRDYVKELADS